MKRLAAIALSLFLFALSASAKNDPPIVMLWPPDQPAVKLTFDKFRQQGSYAGQSAYVSDVTVENLTDRPIPRAAFLIYFFDRNKVRIGQGTLAVADLEPRQSAKIQFQFNSIGLPASLTISVRSGEKTIALKIISVPPGAALKVDGVDSGITPVLVRFAVGSHKLEAAKEGYAPGSTPLEVTADELPGGSVTIELGGMSRDTVELRDGTVLLGDVISMTMLEVVVRVDGKDQKYLRNQIRRSCW
jgi:hypothetical protein